MARQFVAAPRGPERYAVDVSHSDDDAFSAPSDPELDRESTGSRRSLASTGLSRVFDLFGVADE